MEGARRKYRVGGGEEAEEARGAKFRTVRDMAGPVAGPVHVLHRTGAASTSSL